MEGVTKTGQKLFPLATVGQDELTRRFEQAHQALWGGGELNPSEAFDELDKLIFCKLWDERKLRKAGVPYDFQIITEDIKGKTDKEIKEIKERTERELFERLKKLYEEGARRTQRSSRIIFASVLPRPAQLLATWRALIFLTPTLIVKGRPSRPLWARSFEATLASTLPPASS